MTHATATPDNQLVEAAAGYACPVGVSVHDGAGTEVFHARIDMWVSPRKA